MLRAQLKRTLMVPTPRSLAGAGRARLTRRRFGSNIPGVPMPPVPVLKPTLWALAATATILIGCATYDVRRDIQTAKRRGLFHNGTINSYDDLEAASRHRGSTRNAGPRSSPSSKWFPSGQIKTVLADYTDAEKLTLGAAALNISLVGASSLAPGAFMQHFSHIPLFSPNYTLLTASFGHSGLFHAALNAFAMLQFAPEVARSRIFQGNGSHFAAFYLSTGIFSWLGHHLATKLPSRTYRLDRFAPGLGASGVVMAMIGVWGTLYPDGKIGIVFLPGSYSVRDMLAAMVIFETIGLFIGIPFVHFAHGAHLAGLAAGTAYAYFDGKNHIWRPTRRSVFYWMKRLKMV
ncbi:hypothetical protein K449DRAFT_380204 [Hypoxylon sp. EC38]|nr:hypothetical protein K449DRAFT_380204 [Hypoxylon sp. EC38]